jgi:hypothetical protein
MKVDVFHRFHFPFGDMETLRHGEMETWRHGDMELKYWGISDVYV